MLLYGSERRSVLSDSLQPRGLQPIRHLCPCRFSRQEYWSGFPCPLPGDLPKPGIEPRSPTLQVDSLPAEPPGKPKNTGVGSLSILQGIFPSQESNQGLLHSWWILYQLSYQGSPILSSGITLNVAISVYEVPPLVYLISACFVTDSLPCTYPN